MYIATIPNRGSKPTILLRESYREGKKVKNKTLANLTHLPKEQIESMRCALKGKELRPALKDAFTITRTLPHGHIAAVLGTLRKLGLEKIIAREKDRNRDLAIAMIVARIIDPGSKLATVRTIRSETTNSTLGKIMAVNGADEDDLYAAMDWLIERQNAIEKSLAKRHLKEDAHALYDLTSSYFEGRTCSLAAFGYNRDGKKGKMQIEFGLLCNDEGCPIAVDVFEGNRKDSATLTSVINKLQKNFKLDRIILVGDRGMITAKGIKEQLKDQGLEWITALRSTLIRKLIKKGAIQLSLFDQLDIGEITDEDYPGERLVVCKNILLAEERKRKREVLLQSTEVGLSKVVREIAREKNPLRGKVNIATRVTEEVKRYRVRKHFHIQIEDDSLVFSRNLAGIDAEAQLDGFYVIRSNVMSSVLSSQELVRSYKQLSVVENAFRSLKTVDLHVRPIYHRLDNRVRAHVFLCMLAYYVEWHMRQMLAPLLFDDHEPELAAAQRKSVVSPAQHSPQAKRKASRKRTDDGIPVHSFQTLLKDLATIAMSSIQPTEPIGEVAFDIITVPTPLQKKVFDLLGLTPNTG